ncbi:hypothetical protein HZU75_00725 [Chitinibacter fontanus]|uniref:Uncharacterized protein n=1 Tax=Chitinibacter fontanus TaxID=1737446 RepID=A0A7D5V7I7_9NEIS|nr:hypothetical protein [Chitinibacter fontanus]QLI80178.1 hypothetical protein HZU75_00725 [Chitinibacter fontanus]
MNKIGLIKKWANKGRIFAFCPQFGYLFVLLAGNIQSVGYIAAVWELLPNLQDSYLGKMWII